MDWIKKYKLYHIPFWGLYHYAWWSFYSGDPIEVVTSIFSSASILKYLFYVVFQAIGVYFCLYYLIPKFLEKEKYLLFLGGLIVSIFSIAICIIGGYYCSAYFAGENVYELYNVNPPSPLSFLKFNTLPSTISVFTLGMSIKLAKKWIESQQHSRVLEKEKLETELKFLKSQFNPHFLFNTINSVFFLIDKNPVMATETLAKFSNLLRYQLYECNEPSIALNRELEYLKSFIELEEIRLNKDFEISTNVETLTGTNLVISPFILMPFVENAFKHVSHHMDESNWINIEIKVLKKQLILKIANSTSDIFKTSMHSENYSGIGLQNVKRRLELLYPNKYDLEITDESKCFIAILKLHLSPAKIDQLDPV